MERELLVYVDLHGTPVPAGRLWTRTRNGRQSASFEYDDDWRRHSSAFGLDPVALPLGPGVFHTSTGGALFNGFSDGAPDRWGRMLMRRAARRGGGPTRTLFEADFLTLVDDEARQGACRYRTRPDGEFLAPPGQHRIPLLV